MPQVMNSCAVIPDFGFSLGVEVLRVWSHRGRAGREARACPMQSESRSHGWAALGLSYDGICEALKAQGVIVSVSRARKFMAGIAARLPNPRRISPQMLVALRAARRIWDAEQRAAQQSRGSSAPSRTATPKKN
jgi:hypothetical protein